MGIADLFRSNWKHRDPTVRAIAVGKLSDQAALAEVARTDTDGQIRQAAVHRVTDQAQLAALATTATDSEVRRAAIGRLNDQKFLKTVAMTADDETVRACALTALIYLGFDDAKAACSRISDQGLLGLIAEDGRDQEVRLAASECLVDSAILAHISQTASDWCVRLVAVRKVADEKALARVAETDADPDVRASAVERINDQVVISRVAVADADWYTRQTAVFRLADRMTLLRIATTDPDIVVRGAAEKRLSAPESIPCSDERPGGVLVPPSSYVDAATMNPDWRVRHKAVHGLTERATLQQIARGDADPVVRASAQRRLAQLSVVENLKALVSQMASYCGESVDPTGLGFNPVVRLGARRDNQTMWLLAVASQILLAACPAERSLCRRFLADTTEAITNPPATLSLALDDPRLRVLRDMHATVRELVEGNFGSAGKELPWRQH